MLRVESEDNRGIVARIIDDNENDNDYCVCDFSNSDCTIEVDFENANMLAHAANSFRPMLEALRAWDAYDRAVMDGAVSHPNLTDLLRDARDLSKHALEFATGVSK